MRRTRHFMVAVFMCLAPSALADAEEVDAISQDALAERGSVIVRVPFDKDGHPVAQRAQLRVLEGQVAEQAVTDHQSAEAAWKVARKPAYLQVSGLLSTDAAAARQPYPEGYYTWRPGYAPGYFNSGLGWYYGAPGFYYGWGAPGSGYSFGYAPGFSYTPAMGWGYAGGYSGWYGPPMGPAYRYPYPGWFRSGFGYYYYPRHGGAFYRF